MEYSVLMSVYAKDRPEWLKLAIDSMLNQTASPSEFVLIVDGEVSDALDGVIDAAAREYPDIVKIHRLPVNGGLGAALSVGLPLCSREWVARMDADDISRLDRCEKQLNYLAAHPDIDILSGVIEEFNDVPERVAALRVPPLTHDKIVKRVKRRSPFNHMAVMLRRSKALEAGGYKNTYTRLEDHDLWLRMFRAGARGANLPDALVWARCGADMHSRRRGMSYARPLIKLYTDMRRSGDLGFAGYVVNVAGGTALSLMPPKLRAVVYKLLRKAPR